VTRNRPVINAATGAGSELFQISGVTSWSASKDCDGPLQSMGDVRLALDGAFETRAPDAPGRGTSMRFVRAALAAGLATGGLLGAASAWTWMAPPAPSPAPSARVTVMTPANRPIAISGFPSRALAISPDGSQLVYVGANLDMANQRGDRTQLQLRALDSLDVRDLPGTAGARQPFFSPNGQWVGFFTANELKKVSLAGGSPLTLVSDINAASSGFAVWTRNDVIISRRIRSLLSVARA
jgi:serine/threonine-protein kinase